MPAPIQCNARPLLSDRHINPTSHVNWAAEQALHAQLEAREVEEGTTGLQGDEEVDVAVGVLR